MSNHEFQGYIGMPILADRAPEATDPSASADVLWDGLRAEAEDACRRAPQLAPLFLDSIINQPSFEAAVIHRVASRLKNDVISMPLIIRAFQQAVTADQNIAVAFRSDISAVRQSDPACGRFIEPLLYFKGFHAIQTHRLAHWLWNNGERGFSLYLQSRASEVFQTDVHPGARFGQGIILAHATGLVVGETAVVADQVSMLHAVTLGGTGKEAGDRHPKIGRGVLIGTGAKILGNIVIGDHARVAPGSVVLRAVPKRASVAGVPARVMRVERKP
jgi:serine O-acetyltransferase